ncbi:MAG: Kelch repeat-containing protein, partial [Planctomycetota bacterium]
MAPPSRNRSLRFAVLGLILFLPACPSGPRDEHFGKPVTVDTDPPAAVTDLTALPGPAPGMVAMTWTASGDDGMEGSAARYELRTSTSLITEDNFPNAAEYPLNWQPLPSGMKEFAILVGLTPGAHLDMALKVLDEAGNASPLSNVVQVVVSEGHDVWHLFKPGDLPTPRDFCTAVPCGNELVVWGGRGYSGFLGDGFAYDFGSHTWSTISGIQAPSSRICHTAIWTGSEMIVWGGLVGSAFTQTGGRYHRGSNTWNPLPIINAPAGRRFHTMVWTGSEAIVWGGETANMNFQTGARYDPTADAWTRTRVSGAPVARTFHSAVWTGSEMLVFGGFNQLSGYLGDGGRYDPATDSWSPLFSVPPPSTLANRAGHSAIWTGAELIVWGGVIFQGTLGTYLNTGFRFNPQTGSLSTLPTLNAPTPRYLHHAVLVGNEMIVYGGFDAQLNPLNSGGRYDLNSNTWSSTTVAGAPNPKSWPAVAWTGNHLAVVGGADSLRFYSSLDLYDPLTDTWKATMDINGRTLTASVFTDDEVFIWGGFDGAAHTDSGVLFNPATGSWKPVSRNASPSRRCSASTVWTGGEVLLWGGWDGSTAHNTGGRYDPATDTWNPMPTTGGPAARFDHSAVWTGSNMIVYGGSNGAGPVFQGEAYDPVLQTWT